MVSESCRLCEKEYSLVFSCELGETYYQCPQCEFIFQDKNTFLKSKEEKEIYDWHENSPENPGYLRFLNQAVDPLLKYLSKASHGIDFGCGVDPGTPHLLSNSKHSLDLYDPFYFPAYPSQKYDFMIATEVVEHFHSPKESWQKMNLLLKKNAYISVMTSLHSGKEHFKNWYYRKDPTHVSFYNEQSISYLCKLLNWELLETIDSKVLLFKKN